MGSTLSTTTCRGTCGCSLHVNSLNCDRLFTGTKHATIAFYSRAPGRRPVTTTNVVSADRSEATVEKNSGRTVTIEEGEKLYHCFAKANEGDPNNDPKQNVYCWDCLVANDRVWANSINIDLAHRGKIVSASSLQNTF